MAGKDQAREIDKGITPSQTVGPFFAYGLTPKGRCQWDPNGHYSWKETIGDNLVTPDASGEKIRIDGDRRCRLAHRSFKGPEWLVNKRR